MASKLRQTIPWRKATVSERSFTVHFQSYPLALAEKEQLATASAVFGNYDSTQRPFWSREMLNRYGETLNRYSKIFGSGTRNVSNQIRSILGLSVQGLVSHIINGVTEVRTTLLKNYIAHYLSIAYHNPSCVVRVIILGVASCFISVTL